MHKITVQNALTTSLSVPRVSDLKQWAKTALLNRSPKGEVTIRVVEKNEIQQLNATYRHKDKPTNVLSFPYEPPLIGDIVICAAVVKEEALLQNKQENAHWAHMVVHGILHLLGYDHENDADAERMESEEVKILTELGFPNPYK